VSDPPEVIAETLIRDKDFDAILLLLECRTHLKRTAGHRHVALVYVAQSVRGWYVQYLHYSEKSAQSAWDDNLDRVKTLGLVDVFKKFGEMKIQMSTKGERVVDVFVRRGLDFESIRKLIKSTYSRQDDLVLVCLLEGKEQEAKKLAFEYGATEQYYRDLVLKSQKYKADIKKMVEQFGPQLEALNVRIIEQFKGGQSNAEAIAKDLGFSIPYIKVFSFVKLMERETFVVPPDTMAAILNTTERHIKYLRYLLRKDGVE
jgi:hypothetical protein